MAGNHDLDAFRTWLLDRPLDDVPGVLVPAWLLAKAGEWLCRRLVGRWRRWVRKQVAQAEQETGGQDA